MELLGAEIRQRRMARGMSLRDLAKQLHLGGHGTLVDYELGRRIPPQDLVEACERLFEISDGALRNLREKALAARAADHTERLLATDRTEPPPPPAEPATPARRFPRRRILLAAPAAAVVVAGAGVGVWRWRAGAETPRPVAQHGPRIAFDRPTERWGVFWGNQVAQCRITDVTGYVGGHSLQVTVTGATKKRGYSAVGTTHALTGLRVGMKVSFYLRMAQPEPGSGVRFWTYNSKSAPAWAPETHDTGDEKRLPEGTDWTRYRWTVPPVDEIHAIGMQLYSPTDNPLTVWLGAVDW